MMAAIAAAKEGASVTLYEKNEKTGKKLYITGKGRCNVTNNCDPDDFFAHVVTGSKFLFSSYYGFDNNFVMDMVEGFGCPLKTERGNRVFPVSDHSSDVIKALNKGLSDNGVKVVTKLEVSDLITEKSINQDNGKEELKTVGLKFTGGSKAYFDKVIMATGGLSYKSTGSDGFGMELLKKYGHTVDECKPALVPLESPNGWVKDLQGLSLRNVTATLVVDGKNMYSEMGEMLFTHFGVSGPLVLSASSILAGCKSYKKAELLVDLKPALTFEQLDKRFIREFEEGNTKMLKNIIGDLYPSKLAAIIPDLAGVDNTKKVNIISKEERHRLVDITKKLVIDISGTRSFDEAIITHGGINLKEINPSTMESKLIKNLYVCGEMLDVDAFTGGYNLQIAWSTGHLAGLSAAL